MKGIGSQGRQDANQWVKSYTLSYGMNGVDFAHYKENGRVKVKHCSCSLKLLKELQRFFVMYAITVTLKEIQTRK